MGFVVREALIECVTEAINIPPCADVSGAAFVGDSVYYYRCWYRCSIGVGVTGGGDGFGTVTTGVGYVTAVIIIVVDGLMSLL